MISQENVYDRVVEIAKDMLDDDYQDDFSEDENKILHIILSESIQALELVCSIEDEFEIELDDDEIDLYFFSDFKRITECIMNHL